MQCLDLTLKKVARFQSAFECILFQNICQTQMEVFCLQLVLPNVKRTYSSFNEHTNVMRLINHVNVFVLLFQITMTIGVTYMHTSQNPPIALSIAGSDPSGGAGIQCDLKTFMAHRVYGMAIPTMLTVQNTTSILATHHICLIISYKRTVTAPIR